MRSEQQSKNAIMKALNEIGKKLFNKDDGSRIHLLRIFHTSDSVSFRYPDVFHLCFRKRGNGSIIQPKDEVSKEVITKISYKQLVRVFLKMLLADSENIFVFLMLEMSDVKQPNASRREEFDQEFLRSPVWRNLKRFVSFDEFSNQNILEQCKHNTEFHVILNEKMKIGQILEMKQKFSRTLHFAHASIYFKSRIRHSLLSSTRK
ncbi:unnamed protein product [Caenorhabditis brenneri]